MESLQNVMEYSIPTKNIFDLLEGDENGEQILAASLKSRPKKEEKPKKERKGLVKPVQKQSGPSELIKGVQRVSPDARRNSPPQKKETFGGWDNHQNDAPNNSGDFVGGWGFHNDGKRASPDHHSPSGMSRGAGGRGGGGRYNNNNNNDGMNQDGNQQQNRGGGNGGNRTYRVFTNQNRGGVGGNQNRGRGGRGGGVGNFHRGRGGNNGGPPPRMNGQNQYVTNGSSNNYNNNGPPNKEGVNTNDGGAPKAEIVVNEGSKVGSLLEIKNDGERTNMNAGDQKENSNGEEVQNKEENESNNEPNEGQDSSQAVQAPAEQEQITYEEYKAKLEAQKASRNAESEFKIRKAGEGEKKSNEHLKLYRKLTKDEIDPDDEIIVIRKEPKVKQVDASLIKFQSVGRRGGYGGNDGGNFNRRPFNNNNNSRDGYRVAGGGARKQQTAASNPVNHGEFNSNVDLNLEFPELSVN